MSPETVKTVNMIGFIINTWLKPGVNGTLPFKLAVLKALKSEITVLPIYAMRYELIMIINKKILNQIFKLSKLNI